MIYWESWPLVSGWHNNIGGRLSGFESDFATYELFDFGLLALLCFSSLILGIGIIIVYTNIVNYLEFLAYNKYNTNIGYYYDL